MGVPKFYRWISERYPCLSEVVREYQIPEFDNLYLDMNGIIHLCSHPNDEDPHFRITEEKIFLDIFHYIEILFRLIKPQKVFFMAVDGVAPRAKMNQQRGRRFRSAREAEELEARAKQRGEILPKEERFDSNCITPGTVFMAKLHEQLKYFVTMKISTDKMWKGIRVYLSGHETPGEGEHKIMDFIRYEKSQPDYNPNTRHCLYGLDADLIMLGLCTHEPHFSLLREEVRFTGKKSQQRISTPEETTFHLLHLSLMREYLDFEFSAVKDKISFVYDLEKIIDDWVLMGFLVGNDFIPNLPHMHIAHDALPMLYKAYVDVLPSLDGYINEGGYLNLLRFEKYLKRVAQFDYEHFNDTYADLKWFEGKCSKNAQETKKAIRSPKKKAADDNMFSVLSKMTNDLCFDDTDMKKDIGKDLSSLDLGNLIDLESSEEEEEEEEQSDNESADDLFEMEFRQHKRDYYMNKLEYDNVTPEVLRDQAEGYIRAIQWNLHYYYNGVCSWSWYYPHHYAPYISDIKDFGDLNIKFDIGKPFLPFEQLLAVLPAASKKLLPKAYQSLMFDQNSPVIDFYPVDFKTDKNGKQQDWEAVVLIPFINEKRLLEAMKPLELLLTDDEKRRNRCGPCLLYTYSETSLGSYLSSLPDAFPDIEFNYAVCEEIPREFFAVPASELKKGLCSKVTLDVYFPGFPTLKHIKHKAELKKAGVQVFQMSSKNENMILQITEEKNPDLSELAKEILGKSIFVSWPHLVEARVICVSSEKERYSWNEMMKPSNDNSLNEKMNFRHEELKEREIDLWHITKRNIKEHYFHRLGIEIGDTHVIVEAQPVMGRKYIYTTRGTVTLQKHWANQPLTYVLQATVKDITVHDSAFVKYKTVDELFKPKALCFMLGFPHYGHMAEVTEFNHETGRVNVSVHIPQEPDFEPVLKKRHALTKNYMPGYIVAQKLNINSHLVSRITGTLLVIPDSGENSTSQKVNIGLNLKFNKKNQEVPGFTKKVNETWSYSDDTVKIINEYSMKFPEIFEKIARFSNSSTFYADELIPDGKSAEVLQEIQTWLKSLPCYKAEHQKCGSAIIEEPVVLELEKSIDELKANKRKGTLKQKMEVKPQLLYLYSSTHRSSAPDSGTQYYLFDRVVNVREGHSVPFGLRGTVIGIHSAEKEADTMFDILFDDKFAGGLSLRCSENRGYRMPAYSLINISHGIRKDQSRAKNSQKKSNETKYSIATKLPSNSNYFSRSPQSNNITSRQPQNQILNHSPNSPFVPQMGSSNKTTTHNNEFLSIWHQLQQSGNVQPPKLDNSFQNAAKALHNVPPNRYSKSNTNNRNQKQYTYEKSLDYTEGNDPPRGNISDLNYVPKQKDNILFQPSHYSYKRLEGQHNNDSVAMKTESHQIKSNEKQKNFSYVRNASKAQNLGQQVSLEELFRGAQLHESSKNFNKSEGKKPRENTYPDPSNKEYHAADSLFSRPVNPTKPSAVMDLMNFLSSSHLGSPIYQYLPLGPNQLTVAQVKLSNGFNFTGTPCATKEDAAESAALTTLNHLKLLAKVEQAPSFTPSWAQGPRPSLPLNYSNQGPNRFQMGMPKLGFMLPNQQLGFQHPMSKPIPPFNPMASNKRNFHQGRNYHSQGGHTAIEQHCSPPKNQVVNSGMQDSNLRRENPFIPMQVMKQNLVPKKKAEKNSEVLSSEKGKSSSGNFMPTKSSQVAEAAQSRQNTLNTSTSNSSPDKSKPSRARGRGRSRLAINFKNSMT